MNDSASLNTDILLYIDGDAASGERISRALEPVIRTAAGRFLGSDDPDLDDLAQDTLIAFLTYLRSARQAPGNAAAFVTTVAKNRCCNLAVWRKRRRARDLDEIAERVPQSGSSVLDLIEDDERRRLLIDALDSLDPMCRDLLEAIYREERTMEGLRRSLGLSTVQAVYYRRDACVKKARSFLNRRLFGCRPVGWKQKRAPHGYAPSKESDDE